MADGKIKYPIAETAKRKTTKVMTTLLTCSFVIGSFDPFFIKLSFIDDGFEFLQASANPELKDGSTLKIQIFRFQKGPGVYSFFGAAGFAAIITTPLLVGGTLG
jgi:hypothetical protein